MQKWSMRSILNQVKVGSSSTQGKNISQTKLENAIRKIKNEREIVRKRGSGCLNKWIMERDYAKKKYGMGVYRELSLKDHLRNVELNSTSKQEYERCRHEQKVYDKVLTILESESESK